MIPGAVDDALVRRHLMALDGAVRRLRRHSNRPLASLAADTDVLWAVERGLQLCAQNVLDVATHLAAAGGVDAPDYASSIDALSALGALSPDFAARIRGIAGFRNVLVHGYLEVDVRRVHEILSGRLDDFAEFAAQVERYLDSR